MNIVQRVFNATLDFLVYLSQTTGWTYKEVNVVVWYFVIPATWAILLDRILGRNLFKVTFAAIVFRVLSSVDFPVFANELFDRSARFLNSFGQLGGNYVMMSVIICVLIPIAVYAVLLWFAFVRAWFSFLSGK